MSIGWLFLALGLVWLALLGAVLLAMRGESAPDPALDWERLDGEPRLVSTCRELTDLAAKAREVTHG
ncbi:hypothetical protein [Aeromonas diversa]|uniref:hypothetical protein n=1 Tax=Aeromonas diversa TaxID=502790 RepID=UPI003461F35B